VELMGNAKTGISGLDEILSGGLARGHVFLLEGEPGAGKTTVAVQFVLEGAKAGERSLYITLSETEQELRQGAASHGWTLGGEIEVFELIPPESLLAEEQQVENSTSELKYWAKVSRSIIHRSCDDAASTFFRSLASVFTRSGQMKECRMSSR
jgi:circadian clock protein KaiC